MRWLGGRAREASPYGFQNFAAGRQYAQERERSSVYERLTVDQDLELSVATTNHVHVRSQFTANPHRHPDGVKAGDSIGAVANRHPSHRRPRLSAA